MQRIPAVGVLGLMGLVISPLIFSQSTPDAAPRPNSKQGPPVRRGAYGHRASEARGAGAGPANRGSGESFADLASYGAADAARSSADEKVKVPPKPLAAPWHNPQTWARVQEGMSRAQVEEILGKPTSVDAVIDYQTLNYKGETLAGGCPNG